MKKIYLLFISLSIFICCSFISPEQNDLTKIKNYFSNNIETMKEEYYKSFNKEWLVDNVLEVKKIHSFDEEHIGYVVIFNKGWISFRKDLTLLNLNTSDYFFYELVNDKLYFNCGEFYYKKDNMFYNKAGKVFNFIPASGSFDSSIAHSLIHAINYNGFTFENCCCNIPSISTQFTNISWGPYKAFSFPQNNGDTDCGVVAIMNLLHTFSRSKNLNLLKFQSVSAMREELRILTNYKGNIVGEGMLPLDLKRGCTEYINDPLIRLDNMPAFDNVPTIGLYMNLNVAKTAHFAMRVGSASSPYFWMFKTYWDIIVSWQNNIDPIDADFAYNITDYNYMFYVIDAQYRNDIYGLFYKNDVWMP